MTAVQLRWSIWFKKRTDQINNKPANYNFKRSIITTYIILIKHVKGWSYQRKPKRIPVKIPPTNPTIDLYEYWSEMLNLWNRICHESWCDWTDNYPSQYIPNIILRLIINLDARYGAAGMFISPACFSSADYSPELTNFN